MEADDLIFNFEFLRQHGIRFLQQLSGNIWTDYNLHDPGVTILEHLCFVFTDLAYRTNFPIQDILANPMGEIVNRDNSFFTARDILTINPVSVDDKRKCLIDAIPEINNIWLEPVIAYDSSVAGPAPVYKAIVQLNKDYDPEIRGIDDQGDFEHEPVNIEELKLRVLHKLIATRNLCEDFAEVTILKPQFIEIKAGILIESDAVPEEVLANISLRLEAMVVPVIKYATEKDLKSDGMQTETIYQGPRLQKGIILDKELQYKKTEVDPIEFVKAILSIKGVVNIKDLKLIIGDTTTENKPFQVGEGYYPYLKYKPGNIRLYRNNNKVDILESVFKFHYYRIKQLANKDFIIEMYQREGAAVLQGKWRDLKKYHSIQEYFPKAYGLGENRLPDDAPEGRKAAVKQLKGYLMIFEQTLMNYLAQLGNISNFFSADVDQSAAQLTLYYQPAFDLPEADDIIKDFTGGSTAEPDGKKNAFIEQLKQALETPEEYRKKKNQVMDHLLARFNLLLPNLPVTTYNKYYGQQIKGKPDDELRWKSGLLLQVKDIGYYKFRAFDYTGNETLEEGFKKNMYRFLYLAGPYERSLTENFNNAHFRIMPLQGGARQTSYTTPPVHQVQYDDEAGDIQELVDYTAPIHNDDAAEAALPAGSLFNNQTIAIFSAGTDKANYKVLPDPLNANGLVLAFKSLLPATANRWNIISRHSNHVHAETALAKLVEHFRKISIASEGFHMVEHILLRPDTTDPIYRHVLVNDAGKKIMWQKQGVGLVESQQQVSAFMEQVAASDPHPSFYGLRTLFAGWDTIVEYKNGDNRKYYATFDGDETVLREVFTMLKEAVSNYSYTGKYFQCIVKQARAFYVDQSFFNSKLSFVFPLWPARFQDHLFKNFIHNIIAQSCPVHIQPHFVWLNIPHMNNFESVYFPWLESLKENGADTRKQLNGRMAQLVANERYIIRVNPEDE